MPTYITFAYLLFCVTYLLNQRLERRKRKELDWRGAEAEQSTRGSPEDDPKCPL